METIETLPTDGSTERQANDPSPEEIAEACRVIRSRWSEAETRKRMAWAVSDRWEPPAVEVGELEE